MPILAAGFSCPKATYVFRELYSIARLSPCPALFQKPGFSNQRKTSVALGMQNPMQNPLQNPPQNTTQKAKICSPFPPTFAQKIT
jgi:hypothetical protein